MFPDDGGDDFSSVHEIDVTVSMADNTFIDMI